MLRGDVSWGLRSRMILCRLNVFVFIEDSSGVEEGLGKKDGG